jgi:hypothetical protein
LQRLLTAEQANNHRHQGSGQVFQRVPERQRLIGVGQAGLPGEQPLDHWMPQEPPVHRIAFELIAASVGVTDGQCSRGKIMCCVIRKKVSHWVALLLGMDLTFVSWGTSPSNKQASCPSIALTWISCLSKIRLGAQMGFFG